MKKTEKKGIVSAIKKNPGKAAAISVGTVALGAAAYYFLGPKGKENRKSAAKWMDNAKKKVVQKIEVAKEITEDTYKNIVDDVIAPYIKKGTLEAKEIQAFAQSLKRDWKKFTPEIKTAAKKTKKKATESVKKAEKIIKSVPKKTVKVVKKTKAK